MSAIGDFASFVWSIIEQIVGGIIEIVNFIKDLVTFIPKFLSFLPTEISVILLSALSLIIVIFIFKFIK